MRQLAEKYSEKLYIHGLTQKDAAIFGILETDIEWSRPDKNIKLLEEIFKSLNINALLYSELAEPYKTLIDYLAFKYKDKITLDNNKKIINFKNVKYCKRVFLI